MAVPNIFGSATSAIPLSQLDQNFATAITLGNTAVYLGNTTTSLGNVTLTNVTISSGNVSVSTATVGAGSNTAPSITTTGDTNTGIFFPAADTIAFSEGGAESMRIDSAGNMGLGVTPSAWGSGYKVIQVGDSAFSNFGTGYVLLTQNALFGASSNTYINTAAASYYRQFNGSHAFFTAASGTAGNTISFTQAMTLDASGNLGVGSTSPNIGSLTRALTINTPTGGNYSGVELAGAGTLSARFITNNAAGTFFGSQLSIPLIFETNATERARIDSSGNLLVGTTSLSGVSSAVISTGSLYATTSSVACGQFWNQATSGDNTFVTFYTEGGSGSLRGSITYNRAGGLVAYNTTSDYRAKDISGPVTGSGALIDSTPVYMGKMKGATQERPMFIAHETPAYAHTGEKDAVDKDGNPVYQQMDASALIPVMWAEIQSLRKRLATLESA